MASFRGTFYGVGAGRGFQASFGEVTAVAGCPLVVLFHQHGSRGSQQSLGVGKHTNYVGAT